MIRIPFSGDSESTRSLRRCVQHAAREMNVSEFHIAMVMSHFFEEMSYQMAKNRLVAIPCFGTFGPKAWFPRNDPDAPGFAYPAFSGAVPLRNLVRSQCPATGAALDGINRCRRHHHPSSRRDRESRMPFSAHRAFRQRVEAQARRLGFET
ncbi:MAG: hypothetical protein JWL69_1284 [Phycisphaerales bacterium]|nr:hypothetical protein [Phycisphaerales bacterium]